MYVRCNPFSLISNEYMHLSKNHFALFEQVATST
ncbi:hypothetical protein Brsp04_03753 [Brucella sp. NBRC 12952]